jgi:hypothetical protein
MASTTIAGDKLIRGDRSTNRSRRPPDSEMQHSRKNIYIERDIPTFDWEESGQSASFSRKPPKHRRSPHVPSAEIPSHRRVSSAMIHNHNTGSAGPGLREIISANENHSGRSSEVRVGVSQVCSALRAWSSLSGLPSVAVPAVLASRVEGHLRRASTAEEASGGRRMRPVSSQDIMPPGIPLSEVLQHRIVVKKISRCFAPCQARIACAL